jgi:hypothetical protein
MATRVSPTPNEHTWKHVLHSNVCPVQAYNICANTASKIAVHVDTLDREFKNLTALISNNVEPNEYMPSLTALDLAQSWYKLESVSFKRFSQAAKKGKEGPPKKVQKTK